MTTKPPPDDVILLATLLYGEEAFCADELRGELTNFGVDASTQQVAAWLRRLSREAMPTIDAGPSSWPSIKVYSLTRYGLTQLENRWRSLWPIVWERRHKDDPSVWQETER